MMGELGIYSLKPDDSRLLEGMPDPYWAFSFRKLRDGWNADVHCYHPGTGDVHVLQLQDTEKLWREQLLDIADGDSLMVFRVNSQIGGAFLLMGGGSNVDIFRYVVRNGEIVEGAAKRPGMHPYQNLRSVVVDSAWDANFWPKVFTPGFRHFGCGELRPFDGISQTNEFTGVFANFRNPNSMVTVGDDWVGNILIQDNISPSARSLGYFEINHAVSEELKGCKGTAHGWENMRAVCINGKRGSVGDNDVLVNGGVANSSRTGYIGSRGLYLLNGTTSGDFTGRVFPGYTYEYVGYESGVLTDEQAHIIHNRQQAYFKSRPAI